MPQRKSTKSTTDANAGGEAATPEYMEKSLTGFVVLGNDEVVRITSGKVHRVLGQVAAATTVRGNRIDVNGLQPAAIANVDGALLFSDNQIRHAGVYVSQEIQPAWAVTGSADSLVASANHIDAAGNAVRFDVAAQRAAVTGNVTMGTVQIDGAALAAPWDAMNVQL